MTEIYDMKNVLEFLYSSAEKSPEKTVFTDNESSVTYREAVNYSESIGTFLGRKLACVNEPIAVFIDRNAVSICAFLGIVQSRNFYVPIDASQPLERVKTIFGQMKPVALITVHGNCPKDFEPGENLRVYEFDDMIGCEPDREMLSALRVQAMDTDPLYAICTSGSTGVPKGVLISHRNVLDFIPVFTKTFGFTSEDVFGNQAPYDFDVSVKDIYSVLYLGASAFIIPRVCFSMPKKLVDALQVHKVTVIVWAVSALCIAAGFNVFKHQVPEYLKKILFSGETMPVKMLNVWRKYLPDAMYVNLYGPTEITCNCTYYIVDREFDVTEKLPLGIPFENEKVLYLNEENRPIRPGETGEICVCGTCVGLGYYRNPEKTAEAFVRNPLNDRYPERMYRTGDLAVLNENGEYVFTARKDFQIKHMGHRIELEEIEIHLNAIPEIGRACCAFDEMRNKIVAFYTGDTDSRSIALALGKKLPKYMCPNIYTQLENMPITKNGKIDRQLLRKTYIEKK